eukprot:450624-Alexandrium_andersonii.AAC.1
MGLTRNHTIKCVGVVGARASRLARAAVRGATCVGCGSCRCGVVAMTCGRCGDMEVGEGAGTRVCRVLKEALAWTRGRRQRV